MKKFMLIAWLALLTPIAHAAPITFSFDIPLLDGDLAGATSFIDVTVDNGGNVFTNQSYLNTEITGLDVLVGALSASFDFGDITYIENAVVYITTDILGIPTLNLLANIDSAVVFQDGLGNAGQLGTFSDTGNLNSPHFVSFENFTIVGANNTRFAIQGTITNVSEPSELLEELGTAVTGVGPGKSLANKIELAQTYLAVPDVQSTCAVLNAFLNQVRAQRGKKLTDEVADQLTEDTLTIMDAIGCD